MKFHLRLEIMCIGKEDRSLVSIEASTLLTRISILSIEAKVSSKCLDRTLLAREEAITTTTSTKISRGTLVLIVLTDTREVGDLVKESQCKTIRD